jgi:hypothetical protein
MRSKKNDATTPTKGTNSGKCGKIALSIKNAISIKNAN